MASCSSLPCDQAQSKHDASATGADVYLQLPYDLQLRVLSKFANDMPALQGFCFASHSFAARFRDPYLWQLLTEERWGAAAVCPCPGEGIAAMRNRFAMQAVAALIVQPQASSQEVGLIFQNIAPGTYQVFLHKQQHPSILTSSFTTSIRGLGIDEGIEGTYYEALYPASTSIATAAFTVSSTCNVLFCCTHMPVGLRSVQLKKVEQGQLVKVSPQWHMVTTASSSYPAEQQTAVGFEEGGDALWLSLRHDDQMRPQVGKIRPDLSFHFASTTSTIEQFIPQPYYDATIGWSTLYPGVLVNVPDFVWVATDLKHVHAVLPNAVPLAAHQEGEGLSKLLYGARIHFCGWQRGPYRSASHAPIPHRMKTSGELVSLLPGKIEVRRLANGRHSAAAVFTWGGKTTSRFGLEENQVFELLCFKLLGAT